MTPKSQNAEVREVLQRWPLLPNCLSEHVFAATNMDITVEELLEWVFSNQSATKLQTEPAHTPTTDQE